jgi:adenosylmethionine-8-amino-7-oxononanoate aminotransferase
MIYKGIVPDTQKKIKTPLPYWKYGVIENGRKKVDPSLHFGCFVLGYENKPILDYVFSVMENNKPEIAENFVIEEDLRLNHISFEFADRIHRMTGYHPFFALSGSDANEGAVKLASAYHYKNNNSHKKYLVSFEKSYHGSTCMTMSLGSDALLKNPFYTLAKYNNIKKLPRNFDIDIIDWNNVSSIILETASYGTLFEKIENEFWEKLKFIREKYDVLIILDDIFIGGGKTGDYVGWKKLPIVPDIFTMGKAITAGFFPLSMTLCTEKIYSCLKDVRWEHGFTYNFNLSGIASAMKYLDILEENKFLDNHESIVKKTIKTFENHDYKIISNFGLNFFIEREKGIEFFLIPINASDEYFNVLEENLIR